MTINDIWGHTDHFMTNLSLEFIWGFQKIKYQTKNIFKVESFNIQ